ncbi:MAG: putative DNA-binding domain-containing protein [Caulobacter sp.]|nr:putative DNA-binding domain-containing protein [Caulobacter sp.]
MAEPNLSELQRWMQGAILGQAAPIGLEDIVVGDNRLTAARRLMLYARGYQARLLECLTAEFPCLRALAGEQVFDLFAAGYIAEHPSGDPSLYAFGERFADYLEATRPSAEDDPDALSALPAQLAQLDRARAEVQRASGLERAAPFTGAADLMLIPGARLRRPDSVRLLSLDFDPGPVLAAVERSGAIDPPPAQPCGVAVARSHYRVSTHVLPAWRFAWLEALGGEGQDVHAAAARAAQASGRETGAVIADLALWLPVAATLGLVAPA